MTDDTPTWSLAAHGDRLEREFAELAQTHFPLYEVFWVRHVVPLTYRVIDQTCQLLRSAVPKELEVLATTNYGIFVHLVAAHQQLEGDPELFAAEGVYVFYSRLYSVGQSVGNFLGAVRALLRKYDGPSFGGRGEAFEQRLKTHGRPGLFPDYTEAFETRTNDYRNQQVHDWGFPILEGRIPRREFLARWLKKGLGELDVFLKQPDAEARIREEFVDAVQQAKADLAFVERVVNDVWDMALRELDLIKKKSDFEADQARGSGDPLPPRVVEGSSSLVLRFRN